MVVIDEDHHSNILESLGIRDNRVEPNFVKFELLPADNDPFSDISSWTYVKDQDVDPEWYVEAIDKQRAIAAVSEWAKDRIYIGVDNLDLESGFNYFLKDCANVTLRGTANVYRLESSQVRVMRESSQVGEMRGSSQVREMCGSSQVRVMRESSQVGEMRGSSQVRVMWDSSQVREMCGSSQVREMCGSSQVREMCGSSQVRVMRESSQVGEMRGSSQATASRYHNIGKPETLILCDNATFKDATTKTIYQSGDWKLVLA